MEIIIILELLFTLHTLGNDFFSVIFSGKKSLVFSYLHKVVSA